MSEIKQCPLCEAQTGSLEYYKQRVEQLTRELREEIRSNMDLRRELGRIENIDFGIGGVVCRK